MAQHLKGDVTPAQAEELVWLTLQRLEKANLLEHKVVKPAGRKVYTRRGMLTKLGMAAVMLPVVSSIVAPGPVEAQSPQPGCVPWQPAGGWAAPGSTSLNWSPVTAIAPTSACFFDSQVATNESALGDAVGLCVPDEDNPVVWGYEQDAGACHASAVFEGASYYRFGATNIDDFDGRNSLNCGLVLCVEPL